MAAPHAVVMCKLVFVQDPYPHKCVYPFYSDECTCLRYLELNYVEAELSGTLKLIFIYFRIKFRLVDQMIMVWKTYVKEIICSCGSKKSSREFSEYFEIKSGSIIWLEIKTIKIK